MESQKRLLSILHIISGALGLLTLLFLSSIIRIIQPFVFSSIEPEAEVWVNMGIDIVRSIAILIACLGPLPSLIGGIAVLNGKKWGMILLLISGILSLPNFPIGTALGAFTLWVFIKNQQETSQA